MLNMLLTGTIARLKQARDDRVLLEEIADWNSLTTAEVSKTFLKAGLRSKNIRKLGLMKKGYMRLDLMELEERLEREQKGQSDAPMKDWFCVECGELFEARVATCLANEKHHVHLVMNKAPGVTGVRTKNKDDVLKGLVDQFDMTNYASDGSHIQKRAMDSMWASPGSGYNVGAALRNIYPNMSNAPDTVVPMPAMPGKATVTPGGDTFEASGGGMVKKSEVRRPTFVDPRLRDNSPLPSVP